MNVKSTVYYYGMRYDRSKTIGWAPGGVVPQVGSSVILKDYVYKVEQVLYDIDGGKAHVRLLCKKPLDYNISR